jgi:PAS domain S-box-containing protein
VNPAAWLSGLGEGSGPGPRRSVAWLGGLFIISVVGLAIFDTVRSYHATLAGTGRDLESQARVIAEQTARSIQAVDVVLRHLVGEHQRGALATADHEALHQVLKEQAVGLVQADGLALFNAEGTLVAASRAPSAQLPALNIAADEPFPSLRDNAEAGLVIGHARRTPITGEWVFPIVRRLRTPAGDFAGVISASGRVGYFQQFYRDAYPDAGTRVALLHQDATLLARHPPADAAVGRSFPIVHELLAASGTPVTRSRSPIDGADRFAVLRQVPDYPLIVVVTRDADVALAAWREQAISSVLRTLALATLAAALMAVVLRQLRRLQVARASLETSRERFAVAVAGSDDGIWDWDFRKGVAFGSARARQIIGLPPGPEEQSLDEWNALIASRMHADDLSLRQHVVDEHLAGRTPAYAGEFRVHDGQGGWRWIRARGTCVRSATGQPLRMAGSVSDIDAARRAEAALRASEERLALSMAGSNDGLLDWDIVRDRMFTSARAMQIAGVVADDLERTRAEWRALLQLHPDDVQRHDQDFRHHLEGATEVREGDYRLRQPDGHYRWVRVRGMSVRDAAGRAVRWAGSVSDIDAQKRTEERLRLSEERYQLAVDGASQGLWDWDLRSDMLFLSPRAQTLNFVEPGQPLRPRREWIALTEYHPEDVARVRRAIGEHLRGQTAAFNVEYRVRHHSGGWRWYRQRGLALRDAAGMPFRMAGSMEDISAPKLAEAERERLEQQLRQAQKLEAIGTLAGGIAHDFNNILSAILGYGELAQKDAAEGTALRRHLDAANAAALRAKSLVERILAFSRSGIGERVPVHVSSVVAEALDGVAAALPPGVQLQRRLAAGDAGVLGDPTQIHQVVMNLCANAVQAMKAEGTLRVAVDTVRLAQPLTVATSVLAPGSYLRLAVADTGTGIPPHVLERIFDPFFTTKEIGVGTGLGLSLVHGIVTDLGGGIAIDSREGQGATFTVYLPSHGVAAPPAPEQSAITPGAGETVLLVDDEEPLVRLGEELLAGLGYEPVGYTSSRAALAAFQAEPGRFQALLSDEAMPEMTGSELAAAVRRTQPGLPVVLMSGYVNAALLARAREAGVAEVLGKPLASGDIARALALALRDGAR